MLTKNRILRAMMVVFSVLVLAACGETPTPTLPPTWTPTNLPTSVSLTETPIPTVTPTLRPSSTPIPTNTLPPSLTPRPTLTPTPGIFGLGFYAGSFRDDFSDPTSGWAVEQNEDWGFFYQNGGYVIYNNLPNAEICSSRTRGHTDVVIQADVTKVEGPNSAYFGVTCRKSLENFYTLGITGGGEYVIYKTIGSERTLLTQGESNAIKEGNDVTNHLQASCIGSVFSLSVNEVEVVTILDVGPQFGSMVGISVGTVGEGGIRVIFDNFKSDPVEGAPPVPTLTPTLSGSETAVPSNTPTATP